MHRCLFYFYIIVILHNNTLSGSFYTIAIFLFYLLFHEWVNRLFSSFFIELLACFRNTTTISFVYSFFLFFFFSNSFPKDNIHSIKKKRRTGDNYVASKDCVSIDFMWFNFIFRVHIFHVHIDIATKVWVINLWKCHSVNIKSKSGFSLLVAIVGFQRVHGY